MTRRSELWAVVHAERAALVDDLTGLPPEDWLTPSLCGGWDVRDVVAHLAATATLSLGRFAGEFVFSGFSPDRVVARQVTAGRSRPPPASLDALRTAIHRTASPPQPLITRVIEIVVHGEDIRRPLQINHGYSTTHIADALRYLGRNRPWGGKSRFDGLALHATDTDIVVGTGDRVEGPAVSLLLVAAGRRAATADLRGPGCQRLVDRLE